MKHDRWPYGNVSNANPIGDKCEYAHTHNELNFLGEKKVNKAGFTILTDINHLEGEGERAE